MMIIAGDGKANVFGIDTLDNRAWQNSEVASRIGAFSKDERNGDFDIVLTNPPFSGKVTGKAKLSAYDLYELALTGELRSDESEDESDESKMEILTSVSNNNTKRRSYRSVNSMTRDILFLERCLDLLKPGGRMAIVLPQGNFNNLGTASLRSWISSRARVLAIVGLHINTFKKFTNTKTSVLFLQKWGGETGEPLLDYPIFMAISQKSGKNNSGQYKYKRDTEGNLVDENNISVTESGKPPAIDHDLNEIADSFIEWGIKQKLSFLKGD